MKQETAKGDEMCAHSGLQWQWLGGRPPLKVLVCFFGGLLVAADCEIDRCKNG